jgi:toxin ParE1/3/4
LSLEIFVRPEAEVDLQSARDWYDQQRQGLGIEFITAVNETLNRIADMPGLFAVSLRDVRRAKLRRFPYLIYYRQLGDRVEVIGVLHGSRDPRTWRRRAS